MAFQNGIQASKLELAGNINNLDLNEFLSTAMLDDMDQIFEQTVKLDEFIIRGGFLTIFQC